MGAFLDEGCKAWLCIASDGVTTRFGDVYEEVLGETYSWPKSIPQAYEMSVGDVIALWDKKRLLGVSRIETITGATQIREQYRCPNNSCKRLDIRERSKMSPKFKCGKCRQETDEPVIEVSERDVFIARYDAGWSAVDVLVDGNACRSMTVKPLSQHSIRAIDMGLFAHFLTSLPKMSLKPLENRRPGHVRATVKVRVGQGEFRQKLRDVYGDVCAFTGTNHPSALEAAHLYSYAEYGQHHEDGGLLLRRDVHRLFDRGLLAVNPSTLTLDIHPDLAVHAQYSALQGKALAVDVKKAVIGWLQKHWDEFRPNQ